MPAVQPLPGPVVVAMAALFAAVVMLWARPAWSPAAVAGVAGTGYLAGVMHGPAALWLAALAIGAVSTRRRPGWPRACAIAATATLAVLLGVHLLPGFSNPIVVRDVVLAAGAVPYTQYVNFDKTLGGLLLLACSGWTPMRSAPELRGALRRAVPVLLVTVGAVTIATLAAGIARFDPKPPRLFGVWAPINLLTTCVSEEAFFRAFLQTEVRRAFAGSHRAGLLAALASATLFGLAHAAGGMRYALLAGLAGAGYAAAYERSGRVEMSILTHFAVNAVHFLLFTYPALA